MTILGLAQCFWHAVTTRVVPVAAPARDLPLRSSCQTLPITLHRHRAVVSTPRPLLHLSVLIFGAGPLPVPAQYWYLVLYVLVPGYLDLGTVPGAWRSTDRETDLNATAMADEDSDEDDLFSNLENDSAKLFGLLNIDALDEQRTAAAEPPTAEEYDEILAAQPVRIDLRRRGIGNDEAALFGTALLQQPALSSICTELDLDENSIGPAGAVALATACADNYAVLHQLERLSLSGNALGGAGMVALADMLSGGGWPRLLHCDLNANDFGDAGLAALGRAVPSGALGSLKNLYMDRNAIGDAGLVAFAAAVSSGPGMLPCLYELWLSNNDIGDEGATALLRDALGSGGAMANLGDLRMQYNRVGDATATALAAAVDGGALGNLWYLGLNDNALTDGGLGELRACLGVGGLPRLEFVTVAQGCESAGSQSVQDVLTHRRKPKT